MRILIADDDEVSRCKLEALLNKWGYEVISVEDGMLAWEALQQENAPRLAILDWMMPGLDGSEICRQLRRSSKGAYVYVLLLTSRVGKEDIVAGMEAGADDYLSKPFNTQELKVRLRAGKRIIDLEEALRVQATHDALTGVWNHGAIIDMLQLELDRAEREGRSTGAVLVDLDHFKLVNDTYGHLTGDAVLREAAERMIRVLRRSDVLGRYGGEEFLAVLPGCEATDAQALAERLRLCIACGPAATPMGEVSFTISLGVTTTGISGTMGVAAVLQRADEALYQAKREGRNRVIVVAGCADLPREVSQVS
jgi:diguanylate cyclase (GGDEF)-like protein